ncbi:hypothetical protein KIN20_022174 [Parelaphostrongylus tenuis]|uniref:Uncharacterized protein n=1 Tax=Parelaphostrongylus tenuis TaxID=148309 RepID=A0AAD5MTQ3_PARTN|nr:hypothetical protein KIN20_022174 [Parelaphostrongylus tenuis]
MLQQYFTSLKKTKKRMKYLKNVNDWTPLHLATHWGNHRIVERLISQGVDVNAHAGGSMTALHIAVSNPTVKAENVLQVIRHLLGAPGGLDSISNMS